MLIMLYSLDHETALEWIGRKYSIFDNLIKRKTANTMSKNRFGLQKRLWKIYPTKFFRYGIRNLQFLTWVLVLVMLSIFLVKHSHVRNICKNYLKVFLAFSYHWILMIKIMFVFDWILLLLNVFSVLMWSAIKRK